MAIRSSAGLGGSVPQMNRQPEVAGSRPLFHSVRDIALILDKTLQGGYGVLKSGTILAEGTISGLLVPYVLDDHDSTLIGSAVSFVVADVSNGTHVVSVTLSDSYKYQVADHLIIVRNTGGSPAVEYTDMGAIASIDRTTYPHLAVITATANVGNANYTVANATGIFVEAGTGTKKSVAKYILDKDVDTGEGEYADAYGANASVVMSNAVLYQAMLTGYDSTALSNLGATLDGRFLILK